MSFTLVAKFDISLHVPLLLKRADDDRILYEVQLDGYDVSLHLTTNKSFRLKAAITDIGRYRIPLWRFAYRMRTSNLLRSNNIKTARLAFSNDRVFTRLS